MEKKLLLLLCLPLALATAAQQPARQPADTVLKSPYSFGKPIKEIRIKNNRLTIKPIQPRQLTIAGTYTAAAALTTANATPALQYNGPVYNNNIVRKGYKLSHSLYVKATIQKSYYNPLWSLTLNTGQSTENLILRDNTNTDNHLGITAQRTLGKYLTLSGGYSTSTGRSTNSNQYGYLNQVYENALLTPINDPYQLPKSPNHGEQINHQSGFLGIQARPSWLNFNLTSSINAVDNKINQEIQRNQHDTHYNTDANATHTINYVAYRWTSIARLHFLHNTDDVQMTYPIAGHRYHYSRTSDDASLSFTTTYNYNYTTAGLTIADKLFHSNTSTKSSYDLPELSAFVLQSDILQNPISAKLAATYSAFYSEPALNRSWSPFLLTQLLPQESASFMPATEVSRVNGLSPIRHQEFVTNFELTFWTWLTASADLSLRTSKGNPYPLYTNNQLTLQNLADIKYKGLELTLTQTMYQRADHKFTINNTISFWRYTNTVTNMVGGLDSLPIAGFSNVHNTLIKGQPLGVITGNTYLTNKPTVIGNPTPDFTLKLSQQLAWRQLTLSVDWRYVKGGQVWDGTQTVLDYYGRSALTGAYGYTGVASAYMQKADNIRINLLSLAYTVPLKRQRQQIKLLAYAENLMIWSAYKGGDPQQRLFDQPDASGLDFFNLPSTKSFGLDASIQF